MIYNRNKQALMHCETRHSIKGRIRVHCRGVRYLKPYQDPITKDLTDSVFIQSAVVSPVTATVLVYYDADQATADDILTQINSVLSAYSMNAFKAERTERMARTVQERRLQEEPMSETLQRIAITGGTILYSWLRPGGEPNNILGRFLS
ncbi:MAG: hypothetical protein MI862_29365, partial [Desulfobacterales bacterium]|nr:hypothetical protein [Desulfobacterales bacterium]